MDFEELILDILIEAANSKVETNIIYNVVFNTIIKNNKIDEKLLLSKIKKVFTMIDTNIDFNINHNEICFHSKEHDELFVPTLIIDDFNDFRNKLIEYLEYAEEFYQDGNVNAIEYIKKNIIVLLFSNATQDDFNNPIRFIEREINFIKDQTFNEYIESKIIGESDILDSKIEINIKKEPIFQETPYSFNVNLINNLNEGEIYSLPKIRFGIENKICYIKAIQNNKEICNNEIFFKKIKRKLNKVNQNFIEEKKDNIESPENLNGIIPSFLVASTLFISFLKNYGINDIKLVSYFPLRWNSKELKYIKMKNIHEEKGIDKLVIENEYNNNIEEHYNIQRNLSDKLIRNFRRLSYHINNIRNVSYPYEFDEYYNIKIEDNYECNNELLNEIYTLIDKCNVKKR